MDIKEKAKEIISKVQYITLATSSNGGEPWGTPVLAGFDEQYHFFWTSWKGTQHSENIRNNPNIFITIYDSTIPIDTGGCVYVKAQAEELTDPLEIRRGALLRYGRKGQSPKEVEEFLGEAPRRMYKATPQKWWISSAEVKSDITKSRVEIQLP